jgi:hypothetical protein
MRRDSCVRGLGRGEEEKNETFSSINDGSAGNFIQSDSPKAGESCLYPAVENELRKSWILENLMVYGMPFGWLLSFWEQKLKLKAEPKRASS